MKENLLILVIITVATLLFGGTTADNVKIDAVQNGELKEARASWWGFDEIDSTAQLQAALDSKAEKLIIDKQASPWIAKPLHVRKSMEIVFESGAEIRAKKGEFKTLTDSLLNVVGINNVTVRGLGKGGILRMLKPDYQDPKQYQLGEWRHTLRVDKVKNFLVENMSCLSSGGDGILLDTVHNATVRRVHCDDNHRQGISIISGHNILVEDCAFTRTRGTSPQSGMDIEPDHNAQPLDGITVRNCVFADNFRWGILVAATRQNSDIVGPMNIRFEKCVMKNNREGDLYAYTRTEFKTGDPVRGKWEFLDCSVLSDRVDEYYRPPVELDLDLHHEVDVTFRNLTVSRGKNPSKAIQINFNHPRCVKAVPHSHIAFINTKLLDVDNSMAMQLNDYSFTGSTDWISGDITDKNGKKITIDKKFLLISGLKVEPEYTFSSAGRTFTATSTGEMEKYPEFHQILSADYWLLPRKGDNVKFTLKYTKNGRWSREPANVTLVAPSGSRSELGAVDPGKENTFSFAAVEAGIYRVEVRGFYLKTALIASTVPGGPIAKGVENELDNGVTGDLYFYVPVGSPNFAIRLWGRGFISSFSAKITDPSGKVVFSNDAVCGSGVQYNAPTAEAKKGGIWKLTIGNPQKFWYERGFFHVMGASPYFGLRPDRIATCK